MCSTVQPRLSRTGDPGPASARFTRDSALDRQSRAMSGVSSDYCQQIARWEISRVLHHNNNTRHYDMIWTPVPRPSRLRDLATALLSSIQLRHNRCSTSAGLNVGCCQCLPSPVTLHTQHCVMCRVAMTHSQHSCWYRPRYLVFVGDNMILFLQNAVGMVPQSMPCSHLLREILVEIIYFTLH